MDFIGIYLIFSAIVLNIIFGTLIGHGTSNKDTVEIALGIIGAITFVITFSLAIGEYHEPKAIEVYQGKTTLEYTMRDGVVIDSVVVYKDENHGSKRD